jgi:thioredoxin reductase
MLKRNGYANWSGLRWRKQNCGSDESSSYDKAGNMRPELRICNDIWCFHRNGAKTVLAHSLKTDWACFHGLQATTVAFKPDTCLSQCVRAIPALLSFQFESTTGLWLKLAFRNDDGDFRRLAETSLLYITSHFVSRASTGHRQLSLTQELGHFLTRNLMSQFGSFLVYILFESHYSEQYSVETFLFKPVSNLPSSHSRRKPDPPSSLNMSLRPQIFDAIIVGAGPAGLNAALTFARTRSTALVFDSREYRNEGISHMHTVASRDHQDPYAFRNTAREQIESRYDTVWFRQATITHAAKGLLGKDQYDGFEVKDTNGNSYEGRKLILATGSKDIMPGIAGYKENWPEHIYQCLACDGFEQRDTPIGILSFDSPMYAHMVQMASVFDKRITIFSNGPISQEVPIQKALNVAKAFGATLDERKIARLVNNGPSHTDGVTIEFEIGEPATLGFIVHRPITVNRAQHLIEQLGVETVDEAMGGHIKISNPMFNDTSICGVFAAGDTMVMMKQVVIAMAEGMKAAVGAGMQLGGEKSERVVREFEASKVEGNELTSS